MAGSTPRLSERALRRCLLLGAMAWSLAGIFWGAWPGHDPLDAGRGGAFAVAWALGGYFLRRDLMQPVHDFVTRDLPSGQRKLGELRRLADTGGSHAPAAIGSRGTATTPVGARADPVAAQPQPLAEKVLAMEIALRAEANSDRAMSRTMALAAGVGTLAWGFGDIAAVALSPVLR